MTRASGEGERGSSCRERGGTAGLGDLGRAGGSAAPGARGKGPGAGGPGPRGIGSPATPARPRIPPPERRARARRRGGGGPGHLVRGGAHLAALAGPEEVGHPPAARPAGPQDEGEEQQEPREPPWRPARAPHAAAPPRVRVGPSLRAASSLELFLVQPRGRQRGVDGVVDADGDLARLQPAFAHDLQALGSPGGSQLDGVESRSPAGRARASSCRGRPPSTPAGGAPMPGVAADRGPPLGRTPRRREEVLRAAR